MKLRSRGLGRKELVLDFRECDIEGVGDEVVISDTIRPGELGLHDPGRGPGIPGMVRVAVNPHTPRLALGWLRYPRRARRREMEQVVPAEPAAGSEEPRRSHRERSTVIDAATGTAG
jgi:hypothetical protein